MAPEISEKLIIGDVDEAIKAYPHLREFLAYWQGLGNGKAIPKRSDFNPTDVPRFLTRLWLADVVGAGEDFYLRVVGTLVEEIGGRHLSMKRVSELPDDDATRAIRDNLEHCRATGLPVFQSGWLREQHRDYVAFASITLPLSEDGERVSSILSLMDFRGAN